MPLIPSQEASCLIEATLLFRIVHYLWQQQSALKQLRNLSMKRGPSCTCDAGQEREEVRSALPC